MGKKKEVFVYDKNTTLKESLDKIRESTQKILQAEVALAVLLEYAIKREEESNEKQCGA
jgi:hypothetical protein